jgi:hypothetical protein
MRFLAFLANNNDIELPSHGQHRFDYCKTSLGVNLKMYALVDELQRQHSCRNALNTTERRSKVFQFWPLSALRSLSALL